MTAFHGRHESRQGWVHWIHVPKQKNPEPMQYGDIAWVRRERSSVRPSPSELQGLNNLFGHVVTEEQIVSRATLDDVEESSFRHYFAQQGLNRRTMRQPDLVDDYRDLDVVGDLEGRPTRESAWVRVILALQPATGE